MIHAGTEVPLAPCRSSQPLPKSCIVVGSLLFASGGVSFIIWCEILFPRLFTSKNTALLPSRRNSGFKMTLSAENSTLPRSFLGALSRSKSRRCKNRAKFCDGQTRSGKRPGAMGGPGPSSCAVADRAET